MDLLGRSDEDGLECSPVRLANLPKRSPLGESRLDVRLRQRGAQIALGYTGRPISNVS